MAPQQNGFFDLLDTDKEITRRNGETAIHDPLQWCNYIRIEKNECLALTCRSLTVL